MQLEMQKFLFQPQKNNFLHFFHSILLRPLKKFKVVFSPSLWFSIYKLSIKKTYKKCETLLLSLPKVISFSFIFSLTSIYSSSRKCIIMKFWKFFKNLIMNFLMIRTGILRWLGNLFSVFNFSFSSNSIFLVI